MAIQYVGGVSSGRAGATTTASQSLTSLTGGIASAPAAGDLVVVWVSTATASGYAPSTLAVSGYSTETMQSQTGVTNYAYAQLSWKVMTSTPDTSITIPSSGNARNAQSWAVHVFRGVDASTPFDVASQNATGTATGRPDPAAITPSTAGAWILWLGASAAGTGATYTAPTDFSAGWLTDTEVDTYDSMLGAGYYTGWTSGAYNPAAISAGGTTGSTDSWVAKTSALRPKPEPTPKTLSSTLGGAVSAARTAAASLSGAVRAAQSKAASLDGAIRQARSASPGLSGIIVNQNVASVGLSAALAVNVIKSAGLSGAVQQARSATAALGAALQAAQSASASLGAAISNGRSANLGLDALVEAAGSRQLLLSLSGAVQAAQSATAGLDSAIAAAASQSAGLNGAVRAAFTASAGLQGAVSAARSASLSLGALVSEFLQSSVSVGLEARIVSQEAVSAGLDAALATTRTAQAALGAVVVLEFTSAPAGGGFSPRPAPGERPDQIATTRPTATGGRRPPN